MALSPAMKIHATDAPPRAGAGSVRHLHASARHEAGKPPLADEDEFRPARFTEQSSGTRSSPWTKTAPGLRVSRDLAHQTDSRAAVSETISSSPAPDTLEPAVTTPPQKKARSPGRCRGVQWATLDLNQ